MFFTLKIGHVWINGAFSSLNGIQRYVVMVIPGCYIPKKPSEREGFINWVQGLDLNQGPSGYEPDELPDCSTLQQGRENVLSENRPVNAILSGFPNSRLPEEEGISVLDHSVSENKKLKHPTDRKAAHWSTCVSR